MTKKTKKNDKWNYNSNDLQVEDVIFEVSVLEDLKKSMRFDGQGGKLDVKTIKASDKYKKQHDKAVGIIEKFNKTTKSIPLSLSKCRDILAMRHRDSKVEMSNNKE